MNIGQKIKKLTLEEKLTLLTGFNGMSALRLPEIGLNGVQMADGPNGVKTENGDSVCFPNACLMASSWDKDTCFEIGKMLGWECERLGIDLLLAPAVNIKRNPLAGRNFEYYSEDPYLTGVLASEYVKGVQDSGTSVCLKHYACNNQETGRWVQNSVVDDDTLRNIYLKAFEIIIGSCNAESVMSSYNRINGEYGTSNAYLQKKILRDEFGFDGVIMSDWCAIGDTVKAFCNGLDLEMPSNVYNTVLLLKRAVECGELAESEIDSKLERLLSLAEHAAAKPEKEPYPVNADKLRKMTGEAFVLLKNDGALPCKTTDKLLVVGLGARNPRIQGGGCAQMKTNTVLFPLEEIKKFAPQTEYIESYELSADELNSIGSYDKIIVFLTLPESCDSEAYDRADMFFPREQLDCIAEIAERNKNIIAVLQNGSAVDVSFDGKVNALLETYYGGSYSGGAVADVLFGAISPCGKLAETFPKSYKDVPSNQNFGSMTDVIYAEREFVGYRYYTSFGVKTAYPFGYGLSYCNFDISNVLIERISEENDFGVSFDISNNSDINGKETVQFYLKSYSDFMLKMQLVDFVTVRLEKREKKHVSVKLGKELFTRYTGGNKIMPQGRFGICVARSCEDVLLCEDFEFRKKESKKFNKHTLLGDLLGDGRYRKVTLEALLPSIKFWAFGNENSDKDFESDLFLKNSVYGMPMRAFAYFSNGKFNDENLKELVDTLNGMR